MVLRKGNRGQEVKKLQRLLHLYEDGIFGVLTEEAVKNFQKSNGLYDDGIVGDKTWSKLEECKSNGTIKSKREIKEIIVHCTATPEGRDYTVDWLRNLHKSQGWSDIGYHYVIYRDGSVHDGRNVNLVGAHCVGHNTNSIGVCYVGGCANDGKLTPKDTRTNAQKAALEILLRKLRTIYPKAKIYGHRDFANKACPSFDAKWEYRYI